MKRQLPPYTSIEICHTPEGVFISTKRLAARAKKKALEAVRKNPKRPRIWNQGIELLLVLLRLLKKEKLVPKAFPAEQWTKLWIESGTGTRCLWLGLPVQFAHFINLLWNNGYINARLKTTLNIRVCDCFEFDDGPIESNSIRSLRHQPISEESYRKLQIIEEALAQNEAADDK